MRYPLIIVLTDCTVAWLIAVVLVVQSVLMLRTGIPVSGILPLVDRQRCARRSRLPIPLVPSASMLLPLMTPVLPPAGW